MNFQYSSIYTGEQKDNALYFQNNSVIISTNISLVRNTGEVNHPKIQMIADISRQLANQNRENRQVDQLPVYKKPLKPRKLFGPRCEKTIKNYIDFHKDGVAFLQMVEGVTQQLKNQNQENGQR